MKFILFFLFTICINVQGAPLKTKDPEMAARSDRIRSIFNGLNKETMDSLSTFYDEQAEFVDPLVSKKGMPAIRSYYEGLYKNVKAIRFDIHDEVAQEQKHFITWTMYMKAEGLNSGNEVTLEGSSFIHFSAETNKVIYHRDYFDMGEFIYEHIPVLNKIISIIKRKLKN